MKGVSLACLLALAVAGCWQSGVRHSVVPGSETMHHDSFNVRDVGAVGDGKTDDTAAIQRAIDAAHQDGGGQVFLPAGHSLIRTHLNVKRNVTLKGIFNAPTVRSEKG